MTYIVLDMEWNQPMRADMVVYQKNGSRLTGEILQIGAVKIDLDGQILDHFKCNIRPTHYKKIHFKVSKLTGITQKDLDSGLPFKQAMDLFLTWCGKDPILLTWGYDDIPMLRDNLVLHAQDIQWTKSWYNLQIFFNRQTDTGDNQKALQTAMEHFSLPMDRPAHDALNDAYYTALVCGKLDLKAGMDSYPLMSIDEADAIFCKSRVYPEYRGVKKMMDGYKHGKALYCPMCGSQVKDKPFVRQGTNKNIAIGKCEQCGEFLYQLKAQKLRGTSYRLALLVYPVDQRMKTLYKQKVQAAKERAQKMLERAKQAEEEAND